MEVYDVNVLAGWNGMDRAAGSCWQGREKYQITKELAAISKCKLKEKQVHLSASSLFITFYEDVKHAAQNFYCAANFFLFREVVQEGAFCC